jgi:hypothetical protein
LLWIKSQLSSGAEVKKLALGVGHGELCGETKLVC